MITKEFPERWIKGSEPYYPVNDEKNTGIYERYREKAGTDKSVLFAGRLGNYRYYDMDQVIAETLKLAEMEK